MATGTVKWFNPVKGFGFITPDDGGKDVFLHVSALEEARMDSVKEGEKLEYNLVASRGRTCAGDLKKAGE